MRLLPWSRLIPKRRGLWIVQRQGAASLHTWRALLPFVALPLLLVLGVTLAVNRQSWAYALLLAKGDDEARSEAAEVWGELNSAALANLLELEQVREQSELPSVELQVSRRALQLLQESIRRGDPTLSHEPGGHKPYVPGLLRDLSGVWASCKVAYRGLTPPHHWAVKPSLRLRIKRTDVFSGRRYLDLQRPEDALGLINALPEELARELGLLTSQIDHVRLFVNRRFMGVYLRTMRPGDPLALAHGRLPGAWFKGDAFDPTRGVSGDLFGGEGWRIESGDPAAARALLDAFLVTVRPSPPRAVDTDRLASLRRQVDVEAYARWSALLTLVGSSHTDAVHNQVLFWNTYRGRLEPAVWDANGYMGDPEKPVDLIRFPTLEVLSCDPSWVHQRNLVLRALLDGAGSAAAQTARLDALLARLSPDLSADPNLGVITQSQTGFARLKAIPVSQLDERADALRTWLRARETFLNRYLAAAQAHVEPHPDRPGWSRVQVSGTVAIHAELPGEPPRLLYPGLSRSLFSATRGGRTFAIPVPRSYEFPVAPSAVRLTNAVTGGAVSLLATSQPLQPSRTVEPPTRSAPAELTLGPGEVLLSEDLVVPAGSTLTVLAGTTIRLSAGVGIYAQGRVTMHGTEQSPVRLLPGDEEPWACVGLRGPETAGSSFQFVTLRGGSVGSDGSARFLGMLSVYHCPQLTLEGCSFEANQLGDDAVNLAASTIRVARCTWKDARADGLDLDACQGTLEDCTFLRCGNDGLDLMGSRVRLERCVARECGDKGISVGEASRLLARTLTVERCRIGVEVKDASAAILIDAELLGNDLGLHGYQKKWAYETGGVALLQNTTIAGSRIRGVSLEARTACFQLGGTLDSVGVGADRLQTLEAVPETWSNLLRTLEDL